MFFILEFAKGMCGESSVLSLKLLEALLSLLDDFISIDTSFLFG
jgi:hypothetical protein